MEDWQEQRPKRKTTLGAIGLGIGGLAPLVAGILGVWGYIRRGYSISRSGEPIDGLWGVVLSGFLVLAGLGMIGYAIWLYLRSVQHTA